MALAAQLSSPPYQFSRPPRAYLALRESLRAGRERIVEKPKRSRLQKQRRLKDEEVRELIGAYLAGETALALAARFAIAETTVYAHLKRHEVPKRPYRKLRGDEVKEVLALHDSGLSIRKVAARTGWDRSTIGDALREAGQTPRRGRRGLDDTGC